MSSGSTATTASYDSFGHMVDQHVLGGASSHDELDAFGRVIERTIDAASESFTYQGTSEALVQSKVGETATTFAQGPSGPIGYASGNNTRLYIKDLHSDVVAETPASGAGVGILRASWYSPWGERESLDGSLGLLGFQGQPHTQLGEGPELVDMTTRYYQAGLGRFTTGDVLFGEVSDPMSLNRFAYALGSPVTFTDPSGMCAQHRDCNDGQSSGGGGAVDYEPDGPDDYRDDNPDFDPRADEFQTWIDVYQEVIDDAADYFGVPRSVVAGAIVNEKWNDSGQSDLQELGYHIGCETPILGAVLGWGVRMFTSHDCALASYGPGQIQKRRARLVDDAVRVALGAERKAWWCSLVDVCSGWDGSDQALVHRLRDEPTNIYYTAAYLALLRDTAPPGSSWTDIYGTTYDPAVGEYNASPWFISGFDQARSAYRYLDL